MKKLIFCFLSISILCTGCGGRNSAAGSNVVKEDTATQLESYFNESQIFDNSKYNFSEDLFEYTSIGDTYIVKYKDENKHLNTDYLKNIGIPRIHDGIPVTGLDYECFREAIYIESIYVSDGIKIIKNQAFYGCKSLKSIYLSNNLETIGESTFSGCISLESVNPPKSLKKLGKRVFSLCISLKFIIIPPGIETIASDTFYGCINLVAISIPSSLQSFPEKLDNCPRIHLVINNNGPDVQTAEEESGVPSVVVENVKDAKIKFTDDGYVIYTHEDGDWLIAYYGNASVAVIPEGVVRVCRYSFCYCPGVKSVVIPTTTTYLEDKSFHVISSYDLHGVVPSWNLFDTIYWNAISCEIPHGIDNYYVGLPFEGNITTFIFGDEVTFIPKNLTYGIGYGTMSVTEVILGKKVEYIGERAFNLSRIQYINLPKSVKYMGEEAFANGVLKSVDYEGTKQEFIEIEKGANYFSNNFNEIAIFCSDGQLFYNHKTGNLSE